MSPIITTESCLGNLGNLAVDEAIMWLYCCAAKDDTVADRQRLYLVSQYCAEWTSWLSSKTLPQGRLMRRQGTTTTTTTTTKPPCKYTTEPVNNLHAST
ncbi:hypothetical protein EYF80_018496 [Liparis tanakae]|uniref:Uncharacterized protein n=1 Tax=Liparis tanakae TaxID=230148 RepID=A0A4Z2I1X2_9TELE|nr:hypothetical protein EYF80_018496 [Liparis tanakae]